MRLADKLANDWRSQLETDCSEQSVAHRESIIRWLMGEDLARFDTLTSDQLAIVQQAMDYRYRILQQRYLGVGPERAYRKLIQRLSSLFLIRNKIKTWVALSRDRQRSVVDVLQEVIQELLQSDGYMQQQVTWIAQCTSDSRMRNNLLLASVEEYCLRPIRNQPLLVYRFVNYLRRSQRGGMTQVPSGDLVRLVSEEITPDEAENPVSLLDNQAVSQYQDEQAWEEQQMARTAVKQSFEQYLAEKVEPDAARWLQLYLQGHSQEAIARTLDLPIKQVYRLREKISYHAIRVFALKNEPELVANWLETSLQEHSLGLTPEQWQQYVDKLTPEQRQLLDRLREGCTLEAIAGDLNLKTNQVMGEWSKLYLAAQELRSAS
ncbi:MULTISPECIES: HetZ-related protein 2 [Trichocoleus]|uniref:HetZ-related protein 2 n=1 Tax=Trichocoleus desertorum GB2-A4 TaxID=2933944 RepID=A0ABV0J7Z8_9CYAN|nr:HetZ-related protein 2 [Trichocoleus sp. FACHB-46]MBD1862253.1 HetZ-related protein 2 [Trichocoleus sp. FACHB-46]